MTAPVPPTTWRRIPRAWTLILAVTYAATAAVVAGWALGHSGASATVGPAGGTGDPVVARYPATSPYSVPTVTSPPTSAYPTTAPEPVPTTTAPAPSTTTSTTLPAPPPSPPAGGDGAAVVEAPTTTTSTVATTTTVTTTTVADGAAPVPGPAAGPPPAPPDGDGDGGASVVIDSTGSGGPVPVDLEDPAGLLTAVADATPPARPATAPSAVPTPGYGPSGRPRVPADRPERRSGPNRPAAVILPIVTDAYGGLLELRVPPLAVASGLGWPLALVALPGLLSRRRRLVDVTGVPPDARVGDGTFVFRGDAFALPAGRRRRRGGVWQRAVRSPRGTVWLPTSVLSETIT